MYLPDGTVEATDIKPYENLRIAIVGKIGSGKSRLGATIVPERLSEDPDDKLLAWDFDGRKASLHGLPNVHVKTLQDVDPINPTAFSLFLQDIGMLEYKKSQNEPIPGSYMVDTMTFLSNYALNYVMSQSSAGRKEINIGGQKIYVARGFDPYQAETSMVYTAVARLFNLGNVICVFHERPEEAPDSTLEKPHYTGKLAIHPPRYNPLLGEFNEKWHVVSEGNDVFKVQTKQDYEFNANTTLSIDRTEEPNILKILLKHKERFAQKS